MSKTQSIESVQVGDEVHFKLCDSQVIHAADVVDIVDIPQASVYSPARKVYVCMDKVTGWTHRLAARDLRYLKG